MTWNVDCGSRSKTEIVKSRLSDLRRRSTVGRAPETTDSGSGVILAWVNVRAALKRDGHRMEATRSDGGDEYLCVSSSER